ncbi:unnamed protein product [Effrenium voratum]|nr:unnamed protein product [Effrenium voratum]
MKRWAEEKEKLERQAALQERPFPERAAELAVTPEGTSQAYSRAMERAVFLACLVLGEAAEESTVKWVVGARDADCSTVCAAIDSECEEGMWPTTQSEWEAAAGSAEGLLCLAAAPGGWQHNPSVCTEDGPAPGVCFWQGAAGGSRCSGGMGQFPSTVARRICPCRQREEEEESASEVMSRLNVAAISAATRVGQEKTLKVPAAVPAGSFQSRYLAEAAVPCEEPRPQGVWRMAMAQLRR